MASRPVDKNKNTNPGPGTYHYYTDSDMPKYSFRGKPNDKKV